MDFSRKSIVIVGLATISLGIFWLKLSSSKALQCNRLMKVSHKTQELSEIVERDLIHFNLEFEELTDKIGNRLNEIYSTASNQNVEDPKTVAVTSRRISHNLGLISKSIAKLTSSAKYIIWQFAKDASNEFEQVKVKDKIILEFKNQYVLLISENLIKSINQDLKPIEDINQEINSLSILFKQIHLKFTDLANLLQDAKSRKISRSQFNRELNLLRKQIETYTSQAKLNAVNLQNFPEFKTPSLDKLEQEEDKMLAQLNTYCQSKN